MSKERNNQKSRKVVGGNPKNLDNNITMRKFYKTSVIPSLDKLDNEISTDSFPSVDDNNT